MALNFLTVDTGEDKKRPKVVVATNKKEQPVLKVAKGKQRGQLLQSLSRVSDPTTTSPDSIKLTGLSPGEQKRRRSVAAKAHYEKEIERNQEEFSGLKLLGKLLKELPRAGRKTLKGVAEFGGEVARDVARAPVNVAVEASQKISPLLEQIGIPQADPDNLRSAFEDNRVRKLIFGSEDFGFQAEGERSGFTGEEGFFSKDKATAAGLVFSGLDFIPGVGRTGKKFVRLADDVVGSTDDIEAVAKNINQLSKKGDNFADELTETVEKVVKPPSKAENITDMLETTAKNNHKAERIVQTKLRVDESPAYLKVEPEVRFKELNGGGIETSQFKLPKQDSALRRTFTSSTGKISRMGESGSELATRLNLKRDLSDKLEGSFTATLPAVKKLTRKEHEILADALDDLSRNIDPDRLPSNVQQALREWTEFTPKARQTALNAGLDVGDKGKYYYPRDYSQVFSDEKKFERSVRHLVDTGQVANEAEALEVLRRAKKQVSRPFGNLEFSRTYDLPFYEKSSKTISNYIRGLSERVAGVQYLGPEDEIAHELITQAGREGHDIEKMLKTYATAMGVTEAGTTAAKTSSIARQIQGLTKLSSAAIANAGQLTNTASVSGFYRTLKGALKSFSPKVRREVEEMGAISDQIISALQTGAGFNEGLARKVGAPFFSGVEKFNRVATAVAGADWAKKLAKKGDDKSLRILREKLRVTGPIGKQLTDEQLGEATRSLVNIAQFRVDPSDLPEWAASPGGKLVAQFRTFSYKQSGFLWNEVVKEAARGNPVPLTRFIAIGIPVGLTTGAIRDAFKGRDIAIEDPPVIEGLGNVGGFGLAGDAQFLWDTRKSGNFSQYAAGTLGGPSAGTIIELFNNLGSAAKGSVKPIQRQGLRSIPAIGPFLQGTLLPTGGGSSSTGSSSGRIKRSSGGSSSKKSGRIKRSN